MCGLRACLCVTNAWMSNTVCHCLVCCSETEQQSFLMDVIQSAWVTHARRATGERELLIPERSKYERMWARRWASERCSLVRPNKQNHASSPHKDHFVSKPLATSVAANAEFKVTINKKGNKRLRKSRKWSSMRKEDGRQDKSAKLCICSSFRQTQRKAWCLPQGHQVIAPDWDVCRSAVLMRGQH